ncbi:MAG: Na+/H+ antiporter subunit E [Azonexus sp.]|nr:Na+/H+ antiporter subunit E [Azonexus sp.]MDZ4314278.1 Na+/H+ antiporter subunit E [Azonexus sp.]
MISAIFRRGLMALLLWWILTEGRSDAWGLGLVAVMLALWLSLKLLPPKRPGIRLIRLPGFVGFFIWNSILGGLQVAFVALRGRQALQPGVLELSVSLPAGAPRLLLINLLGLMPGTLGMQLKDDHLRLHGLDERRPLLADVRALEQRIAHLFGITP